MVSGAFEPSTNTKRSTAWRSWLGFLRQFQVASAPTNPSELTVCLWLAYLFHRNLAYNSIRTYLYSLAAEIKLRGGASIIIPYGSWFIRATLRYVMKTKGAGPIQIRRPLTVIILERLVRSVDLGSYDNLVLCAMLAVGVYGMLRIGEVCYQGKSRGIKFIANKDLSLHDDYVRVILHKTKTDIARRGVEKIIGNVGNVKSNPFVLVRNLKMCKLSSVESSQPFFALKDGKAVTRQMLVRFLQKTLSPIYPHIPKREWSGVSLRKGGATSALKGGVAGETIEYLGHWRSNVYKTYISHDTSDIKAAQQRMAAVITHTT